MRSRPRWRRRSIEFVECIDNSTRNARPPAAACKSGGRKWPWNWKQGRRRDRCGVRHRLGQHRSGVGSISPGPVITALLADWPPEKLREAKEAGSLLGPAEVANVVTFMLTRPRAVTTRDVVMLPSNFDL